MPNERIVKGKLVRVTPSKGSPYKIYYGLENLETIEGEKRSAKMDVPIVLSLFKMPEEEAIKILTSYQAMIGKEVFILEEQNEKQPLWWNTKCLGLSLSEITKFREEAKSKPKWKPSKTLQLLEEINNRLKLVEDALRQTSPEYLHLKANAKVKR